MSPSFPRTGSEERLLALARELEAHCEALGTALQMVGNSWVNGRRVFDGAPMSASSAAYNAYSDWQKLKRERE